jgi:tripartite-type tricarboxylate transporter receptor subunit TctC
MRAPATPNSSGRRALLAAAAVAGLAPLRLRAQGAYPNRPITLVVPFAPGGFVHVVALMLSEAMGPLLGQPLVVTNRPGANGNLAADSVARAAGDGYTVFLPTASILSINPHLYKNVGFDPLRDFAPIGQIANTTNVFVTSPASGIKTLKDLVERARASGSSVSYGSSGAGSIQHIAGESLKQQAGIPMLHVPYKGIGPAVLDVMGERLTVLFSDASALPNIKGGKLTPLAVSPKRIEELPGVPSVAEAAVAAGIPGYRPPAIWYGLVAPKGTPAEIIATLNDALQRALALPAVRGKLEAAGAGVAEDTSAAFFGRVIQSDHARYAEMLKALNISAE